MEDTRIHISLRTADLEAAVAFYTRLFGGGPDKRREGYARFRPAGAPIVLALMPGEPGVDHFGVRSATVGGAEADWARLAEAGLEVAPSRGVVCCHAAKDEVWLRDPDGNPWEIYAVTDEAPVPARASGGCCA